MLYQTSRHLWLQGKDDQVMVSNVCTGRRALLSGDDLEHLETFTTPRPDDLTDATRRLLDADLVVPVIAIR